eukprot:TRINITY_DN2663_c0_g1_i2.p1 TRINITY_DN2663_c0_g1~~TRINITY_DN2663_c0_g1_i2.p1  ORF type:complete len:502 (+),score=2.60 TRINITY_DN2663_c0_g1_i2:352-1857(+)
MDPTLLNYQYDEILPIRPPNEPFDPPIEDLYPQDVPHHFDDFLPLPSGTTQDTNHLEDPSMAPSESLQSLQTPSEPISSSGADATYEESSKAPENKKTRIKEKISKAKDKYPAKTKLIKKEPVLDQKQKQLIRNRISAQRSRDRKKQEVNQLKQMNEFLERSKAETDEKLAMVSTELEMMKKTVELLSPESREEFNRVKAGLVNMGSDTEWAGRPSRRRSPFLLAAAILGCICLIGCLSPFVFVGNGPAPLAVPAMGSRGRLLVASPPNYNYAQCCNQNCEALDQLQQVISYQLNNRKCRKVFIGKNMHEMRSLPSSDESKSLALYKGVSNQPVTYAENNDNLYSPVDNKVDTVYADHVYLLSPLNHETMYFWLITTIGKLRKKYRKISTYSLQYPRRTQSSQCQTGLQGRIAQSLTLPSRQDAKYSIQVGPILWSFLFPKLQSFYLLLLIFHHYYYGIMFTQICGYVPVFLVHIILICGNYEMMLPPLLTTSQKITNIII